MAFVPQYTYDIFVSYAHVDDLPEPVAQEGWVTTLVRGLKKRLAQKLGRNDAFTLWMDRELAGNVPITPEILHTLQHSATLLLILSPGDNTGSVRLWEPYQLEAAPIVLDIPETTVTAVAFSPDDQHLATSSYGGPVRLWHVHQRDAIRSFPGNPEHVTLSVAFSPDGQRLASGSNDGTVRLWDLHQPEAAPVVLPAGGVPVYTVAFSPDNQRLAAGSLNSTAWLWNLHQPEVPPIVLRGHTGPVFSVVFSPDGQSLATGSHDQTIRLWQVQTAHLADVVCERVWRNLTLDEWHQFIGTDSPYEHTCPNLPIHPSALEAGQEQTKPGHGGG